MIQRDVSVDVSVDVVVSVGFELKTSFVVRKNMT